MKVSKHKRLKSRQRNNKCYGYVYPGKRRKDQNVTKLKGSRGEGNEYGERESKKWKQSGR